MQKIREFLKGTAYENYTIEIASSDASFRRYFRLISSEKRFILMDASLEKESLKSFIDVTLRLHAVNIGAPQIYLQNLDLGFLILEDLGNIDLLQQLDQNNFITLYQQCIDTIITIQKADTQYLPLYDDQFLKFEMNLMQEWFLERYLKMVLTQDHKKMLTQSLDHIAYESLQQPQGYFVHRDFHSRNIMLHNHAIRVIDYQDAMNGALTYDLVSLLKDLYIRYEPKEIEKLALYFRDKKGLQVSDEEFIRWFDFIGLQRHIKVLGIFARLYLRDGKSGYLKDLPLTLQYVLETSQKYELTTPLYNFLKDIELP
jgi:aminoglycoside/choline kinase family phosphotransferase